MGRREREEKKERKKTTRGLGGCKGEGETLGSRLVAQTGNPTPTPQPSPSPRDSQGIAPLNSSPTRDPRV